MKKAFIITGAQNSGNHLMTDILIVNGCYGEIGRNQNCFDYMKRGNSPIVWRGSMPKGGIGWYNLKNISDVFENYGYAVQVIVMIRDWYAVKKTQTIHFPGLIKNEEVSLSAIKRAYKKIMGDVIKYDMDYYFVSYEGLIHNKNESILAISQFIDYRLDPQLIHITNENLKHYEGLKTIQEEGVKNVLCM